jgi:hypothetical protein
MTVARWDGAQMLAPGICHELAPRRDRFRVRPANTSWNIIMQDDDTVACAWRSHGGEKGPQESGQARALLKDERGQVHTEFIGDLRKTSDVHVREGGGTRRISAYGSMSIYQKGCVEYGMLMARCDEN